VLRLRPRIRLVCGAGTLATCVIAPVASWRGLVVAFIAVGGWLVACRPPLLIVRRVALLAAVLFLPYFLLTPWLSDFPAPLGRLEVPWTIFARGTGALLVTVAGCAVLSPSDLRDALGGLPIPRAVTDIVLQIVHQSGALAGEARRIAAAMAVRGATARNASAAFTVAGLPRVWIPRVLERADRVALAMDVRGYCEVDLEPTPQPLRKGDVIALLITAALLASAVVARWA